MEKLGMILPLLVPIIGTLFIVNKRLISDKNLTKVVAVTVIINFVCVVYSLFFNDLTAVHILKVNAFLDIYFKVDQLTRVFSLLASSLWVLTAFYAFAYMDHEKRHRQFYTFFTLTLAVIMGVAYSGNLFTLYGYYELLTLCTLPLVIHPGTAEALQSGKKYIIYSFGGATLVVLGMMMLYAVTGDMSFMAHGIVDLSLIEGNRDLLKWSYLAMFLGFGVKAALVPFHSWLPNAMVAPTPVSALLHAVAVVKSGVFSLIRMTYFIFGTQTVLALDVTKYLMPFVVVTIVMGSLLALHQDHLKRRLAYSTISQLGYILLGILMLTPNGLLGAMLHLINHAVIKITLFFVVGAITHMTHFKYIHQIRGIGKQMPITMICFTVAAISLVGIPPTNGFVSKWFLGLGALNIGNFLYIIILLLSAFFTAGYLLPISVTSFFVSSKSEFHERDGYQAHYETLHEMSDDSVRETTREMANDMIHEVAHEATHEAIHEMANDTAHDTAHNTLRNETVAARHSEDGEAGATGAKPIKLEPPKGMLYPIVLLTVIIVGLGIFPNTIINFLGVVIQDAF
jgi:multicomponent Na+:H+ antiporter subunit D